MADVQFDNGSWHTVVIAGERQGGAYYYALDISDVDNPQPLWEFTHTRLGQTGPNRLLPSWSGHGVAFVGGGRPYSGAGCNPGHGRMRDDPPSDQDRGRSRQRLQPAVERVQCRGHRRAERRTASSRCRTYSRRALDTATPLLWGPGRPTLEVRCLHGEREHVGEVPAYDPDDSDNSDNGTVNRRPVYKSVASIPARATSTWRSQRVTKPSRRARIRSGSTSFHSGRRAIARCRRGVQEAFWFTGKNGAENNWPRARRSSAALLWPADTCTYNIYLDRCVPVGNGQALRPDALMR